MNITGLPIKLDGDAPKEQSAVLDITVGTLPAQPFNLEVEFTVTDADSTLEGELYCNDEFVGPLWPDGTYLIQLANTVLIP